MKNKLIEAIRSVPIADKTYAEYVEAVADTILSLAKQTLDKAHIVFINGNEDNPMILVDYSIYKELKGDCKR